MNPRVLAAALLAAALLGGCATAPPRPHVVVDPALLDRFEIAQQDREQRLRADTGWALSGRIAVSNAGRGGSGRLEWRQDGDAFEVSVSAPVTRQSWRLGGGPAHALLEGVEGGPRRGHDAQLLLLEATGWDVPLRALPAWMRGLRAPGLGPARIGYAGEAGLPLYIEQDGWRIEYDWPPGAGVPPALPSRVQATRGEARVRLVIDEWSGVEQ